MPDTELVPTKVVNDTNKGVESFARRAASLTVTSLEQVKEAEMILQGLKTWKDTITGRKEEITRPLMASLASVRDMFRPAETSLAEAEKIVKRKMLTFHEEEEAKQEAAKEKLTDRVERGTMREDTAVNKIATMTRTSMKTRTLTKVRVVDEMLIPRQYLIPDMKEITEAMLRGGVVVPGCETYKEKIVSA